MRRVLSLFVLSSLVALTAACGNSGATATPNASGAPAAGGSAVSIIDLSFKPVDLSVKVGTKVVWTNNDGTAHTVKWSDGTPESARLATGQPYDRTFDKAGAFPYVCGIHGTMKGTITVTG